MPAPTVSDAEFIALWRDLASAQKVADALGISSRATQSRRRAIETRHKITLPVIDDRRPSYNATALKENRAVIEFRIADGVVLVGSDAHIWPGQRTTMQRAFVAFAAKLKPAAIIANGDFFDGSRQSRWPSIGWETKPTVKQELDAVADYMGDLVKASPGSKRFWPLGNHDARFESRIAANAPELEGVHGVHLKDHMPMWSPCWRVDINDDIVVRHRELGGEHADYRNVQTAGKTVVTGHDHRTGVVPYRNYRGLHFGVRCGYLADSPTDPQFVNYLEGREPNWHPAFVVLTFVRGRLLWPELVTKHDEGEVVFRGEVVRV